MHLNGGENDRNKSINRHQVLHFEDVPNRLRRGSQPLCNKKYAPAALARLQSIENKLR
jgi:hypothetical protein